MSVYADLVFNHKMGADAEEETEATPFDPENRYAIVGDCQPIKSWTHFTFPGRDGKYSTMQWHWWHFDATDYNAFQQDEHAVFLLEGKHFDDDVD